MKRLGFDLVILGVPTSGKDTQAVLLRRKYNFKPVESGKYWRRKAAENNAVGDMLRKTYSLGKPAPVALMKKFLIEHLNRIPKNKNLLFVGNPRLKPEAQMLVRVLKEKGRDFYVLYLTLPEKEIKLRSTRRMRDAQDIQYLRNRINYHKTQVSKTVQYFKGLKKLAVINGNQGIKEVERDILKAINDYARSRRN